MFGRNRGIDPTSLVAAVLTAQISADQAAIASLDAPFRRLSAQDIFGALGNLGQLFHKSLKPEQIHVIRDELAAQDGTLEVKAAINDIGTALLVDVDSKAASRQIVSHTVQLQQAGQNLTAVVMGCLFATAGVMARLNIEMNFK